MTFSQVFASAPALALTTECLAFVGDCCIITVDIIMATMNSQVFYVHRICIFCYKRGVTHCDCIWGSKASKHPYQENTLWHFITKRIKCQKLALENFSSALSYDQLLQKCSECSSDIP